MESSFVYCPSCRAQLVPREHGGRSRRACPTPDCGFVHWGNPVPVVAAIVECDGHVLLIQNVGWPAHWFGLVTGFLEHGEDPSAAAMREVAEEVGLDGAVTGLVGLYPFARRNQLIIAYHFLATSRDVVKQPEEIADFRWVPIERLTPWDAATGLALLDWLRSRGYERTPVRFGEHLQGEAGSGTGS